MIHALADARAGTMRCRPITRQLPRRPPGARSWTRGTDGETVIPAFGSVIPATNPITRKRHGAAGRSHVDARGCISGRAAPESMEQRSGVDLQLLQGQQITIRKVTI
jgi:hypothetical protein